MAQLESEFEFTGSLGNLSAYKMRGVDRIVIRTKGGASRDKILKSPEFELTRRNISEFSGCSTAGRWVRYALYSQRALADYNISGPLNALMKSMQLLDKVSEWGKRSILLSKNPTLLEGFSLNRYVTFES